MLLPIHDKALHSQEHTFWKHCHIYEHKIYLNTNPSKPYIHKNHLLHTAYAELIFKFLARYFLNLYFFLSFEKRRIKSQGGKGLQRPFQGVLSANRVWGRTGLPIPQRSEFPLIAIRYFMEARGNGAPTPAAYSMQACHTAHVKHSSAWQRTDTEQGNAENLLQHGNWGHYSAGSRCKRSPRTQTPTIKTQSQHRSGSSGCTITNPPKTRGSEQDGQGQGYLLWATTRACKGRGNVAWGVPRGDVQDLTKPRGRHTPSHAFLNPPPRASVQL